MNKPFIFTLAALLTAGAFASPSQLTPSQLAKIKKLGRVVIPSYIPPGFKLKSVTTDVGETLEYKGPHGADLLIQMASDGIGDIPLGVNAEKTLKETTRKVHNPVFGNRDMDVATAKGDREFAVNWVDLRAESQARVPFHHWRPNERRFRR
jgi:hypothetical protein